jgi:DNA helicase HerA-like ATPase
MPRKKKIEDDIPKDGKIQNMYEVIPKRFLQNAYNPNYELHKLKLPFRMCVVAPSGSGKTNFVINLLRLFSAGDGTFSSIVILTKNKNEPLYEWLMDVCPQISIQEGLSKMPRLDDYDKKENHLLIFDDLVLSKDLSMVENVYIRGRKLGVSVIFISQSYFKIPKIIRLNTNYMVLLKIPSNRDLNMILSEAGIGLTKDELMRIYDYATAEKFSPLLIDCDEEVEKRYRKGFLEILDKNNFK